MQPLNDIIPWRCLQYVLTTYSNTIALRTANAISSASGINHNSSSSRKGYPHPALQPLESLELALPPSSNPEPFPDRLSPLQMAVLGAILANGGISEPLMLVSAVDTPQAGWVILPVDTKPL